MISFSLPESREFPCPRGKLGRGPDRDGRDLLVDQVRVLGEPVNELRVFQHDGHVSGGNVVLVSDQDELGGNVGKDLLSEAGSHPGVDKDQVTVPADKQDMQKSM